ncbi:MAG: peptidylprolyl isomerase [Gammaproteobacteria bacterium]
MQVNENCAVSIHYTLTNDAGEELDSSAGQAPLTYLHGAQNIIPGLEQALAGKAPGDNLKVSIEPKDGYGEQNPELLQTVPMEAFQGVDEVKPGMVFGVQGPGEQVHHVTVKEVEAEEVVIDGNHPLAGQTLHFDVTIEDIREATPDEIEQGQVGADVIDQSQAG